MHVAGRELAAKMMKGEPISAALTESEVAKARVSERISKMFLNFDLQDGNLKELWDAVDSVDTLWRL